jgi:hypothetical protein
MGTASYQGDWILRAPSGELFGAGSSRSEPFSVRIQAYRPAVIGDYALDFGLDFCAAEWQSAAGRLTCPGERDAPYGIVQLLDRPFMENGRADGLVLWTRPGDNQNNWISGQFPLYTVQENDHFQAQIGCLVDSQNCDVTFQLIFQTLGGASRNLGSWREVYDGLLTSIDIDLTSLTDVAGRFVLYVTNNRLSQTVNAAWVEPRIENLSASSQPVMTWTRDNGTNQCVRLEIYLTSTWTAEARAFPCAAGADEIGRTSLSQNERNQLLNWYSRLEEFDSEIYQAAGKTPVISYIYFQGQGSQTATNNEILNMNDFASVLVNRIIGQ